MCYVCAAEIVRAFYGRGERLRIRVYDRYSNILLPPRGSFVIEKKKSL